MYFKKLEIFGFKSFADRTKLVFEPGVTAVVGPNGVGKSNISDAIKWVLGEQSAKELRGGKMEDVIFNGTDTVQPVNIAEVSLTLSNEDRYLPVDYDEVVITRRVFRSGESEYLLNKTQVRLKDIQNILLGTGIGTSSYSIAEQGKMDRVLNSRPEDRREIFEEASGITKYKAKRKEALKKLEHTENNLARLADIVNEVKRQIGSIERQARKAEKYQQEFNHLKELDIKLSFYKYKNITGQKTTKDTNYEQLKLQESSLAEKLTYHVHNLKGNRGELNTLDVSLSDIRNKLVNIITTIDRNKSNITLNKERANEIISRRNLLTEEIEQAQTKAESLKIQIAQIQQTLDGIGSQKNQKQSIVTQQQEILDNIASSSKDCEAIISQSKLSIMDNMAKQSRAKNETSKLLADMTSSNHRRRRLSAEKEAANVEISGYADNFNNAQVVLKEETEKTNIKCAQLKETQSKIAALNQRLSELDKSIVSSEKSLISCASKLEIFKNLSEKSEGLSEGVKAYLEMIKEAPEAKASFLGVLVDIIRVKPGYEMAVEAALGEEVQSIVLKDKTAAVKAIDYLKNYHKGKASFVTLDRCAQSRRGFGFNFFQPAERLSSFVDCEDMHKKIISSLFEDTFFAENIEEGLSIINKNRNKGIKVVTRDGSCVFGNRIAGGGIATSEYTGVVGRKDKLQRLSQEIERLTIEIDKANTSRADLITQIDSCQGDLSLHDINLREQEKSLAASESNNSRLESELKKLEEELNLVKLELEEISQQDIELKSKEVSLGEELNNLESEHQALEDTIADRQKTIDSNILQKENIIIGLTEAKTELSLLSEKYTSQENTFNMLDDSLSKEHLNLESRRNQIIEGEEKIKLLSSECQRLSKENEILEQQKEQFNAKVTELQQKRHSITVALEKAEEDAQTQQKEIEQLKSNIATLQVNTTELNYQASSIKERVQQAYKVNINEADVTFSENQDWEAITQEVDELKVKVEKMGPVNLVAIEEHKELQERYEFLSSQQQDLFDAKESLHKAINRINRTTRKLFTETFEKIKIYFKDYFKLLFGGGTADICLIDQADILESGIEIIVRPPGKKLQNISLLSGGEKALTSTALLFALFKVRPSPFCILDEIDAPLDEANIDRFSRILQEFVKTSQFIIITHNKKTISIADVMYGITMEKSGISKIVSVKFAQDEIKKKEKSEKKVEV